jgi:hypothetical protein
MLRRPETRRVAEFLYDILVANAPSNDYAKRVAERMDVPYPSLARYWQGKAVFPAGLVRSLFLATDQDLRVAEFFLLEGTEFRIERRETQAAPSEMSRALMSISQIEGEVSGLYLQATREDSDEGRSISFQEARSLEDALRRLTRVAEELRAVVQKLHARD